MIGGERYSSDSGITKCVGWFRSLMSTTVWFLTGNKGKLREAQHHLAPLGYEVRQFVVEEGTIVEPQHERLVDVALEKLRQARLLKPEDDSLVMVEDAGLFIESLGDFPGVFSSYIHSTIGLHGILRLLNHVQSDDPEQNSQLRKARFEACIAIWKDGEVLIAEGICHGSIANEIRGEGGFGFDPLFIPADLDIAEQSIASKATGLLSAHGRTFAEMTTNEKNEFSHRRKAIDHLLQQLSHH